MVRDEEGWGLLGPFFPVRGVPSWREWNHMVEDVPNSWPCTVGSIFTWHLLLPGASLGRPPVFTHNRSVHREARGQPLWPRETLTGDRGEQNTEDRARGGKPTPSRHADSGEGACLWPAVFQTLSSSL